MRANEEGPDAAPGPRPAAEHRPAHRDPGGAGLRHRTGSRARPPRRAGPGRPPPDRPQPGPHDRSGDQHLPGRHRRAGRHRPRPGRRDPHGRHPGCRRPLGPIRNILVTHTHSITPRARPPWPRPPAPRSIGFGPAEDFAPDERVGEGWTLLVPGAGRGRPDPAGGAHAGPRLRSPVLARRGARPPPDRRPRDARLHRGDPPARRGPGPVPGQPGPASRRHAAIRAGARARPGDGPRARRVDALWPTGSGRHETDRRRPGAAGARPPSTSCCPWSTPT